VITSTEPAAGRWSLASIDSGNVPTNVACVASQCVIGDNNGDVLTSTEPTGGEKAWTLAHLNAGIHSLRGVSCSSSSLCVAVDNAGNVVTSTDPANPSPTWTGARVDETYLHETSEEAGESNGDLVSSTNPTGGASAWTLTPLGEAISQPTGISCTASDLCVVTAGGGKLAVSTNPTGGKGAWSTATVDSSGALNGVACPTGELCVAVDGAGDVVTSIDPTGGASAWTVTNIDGARNLTGVSCVSASLCVAVDESGNVLTSIDPTGEASTWKIMHIDENSSLTSVSCSTSRLCTAVDKKGDTLTSINPAGGAATWEFSETDPAPVVVEPLIFPPRPRPKRITGVACPSADLCVIVDDASRQIAGTGTGTIPAGEPPQVPITEACSGPIKAGEALKLCGTLNPNASAKVGYYFAYSRGNKCTGSDELQTAFGEIEGQSMAVHGEPGTLRPGTVYTYCLAAVSEFGESFGQELTFKTEGEPVMGSPTVSSLEPESGPSTGGTRVVIHGDFLENARSVYFGATAGKIVEEECGGHCEIVPYTTLVVESPPHEAGAVDVRVETAQGTSSTNPGDQFTYSTSAEAVPGEVLVEPAEQTSSGFKLKGKLNPENSPTTYYFIYKLASAVECEDLEGCGPSTTHEGPLTGDTEQEVIPAEVAGLEPNTTYIYWLIARNAKGTVRSNELTFTTPPAHARPLGGEEKAPSMETPSTGGDGGGKSGISGTQSGLGGSSTSLVPPLVKPVKPTVLTRTQKLAKALSVCKKDKSKRRRAACEKQARKRYAPPKKKKSSGK
jgi:hypothetical protein